MLRRFNLSMVIVLDGAHVHTSYVVYVHGGCIDLVGRPLCGKLKWLKNLSISEGMLRRFNWSMVIGTCLWPCSYVVCSVCSWGEVH